MKTITFTAWTIALGVALASCFVRIIGGTAIRIVKNLPDTVAKAIEKQAIER